MPISINPALPSVMHVDLKSAYCLIEQQAHVLLRHKPIVVVPFVSDTGCVISASPEAKRLGIKVAEMNVREARRLCPDLIAVEADPDKYKHVHGLFCKIFTDYTPDVTPLSIDEAVLNLTGTPALHDRGTMAVALEIKDRIRDEIGCYMECAIGIGTNRFLAKTASDIKNATGIAVIDRYNLRYVMSRLRLTDLSGIASRNAARLCSVGVTSPLEFMDAEPETLKRAFRSINWYYWQNRLYGWEIDGVDHPRGSYGNSYSLRHPTADPRKLGEIAMKLSMKSAERMRHGGYSAKGVHVGCGYGGSGGWHKGMKFDAVLNSDIEIYRKALHLLDMQPRKLIVTNLAISEYDLVEDAGMEQLDIFDGNGSSGRRLTQALDKINDTWGQYTVFSSLILGLNQRGEIVSRISFGGMQEDMLDVYERVKAGRVPL